uniref:Uncharacterized protein n=1 Tax=Glossina pallidipes TaxID=7398 RepID=A0A1A9Z332_GLOPL
MVITVKQTQDKNAPKSAIKSRNLNERPALCCLKSRGGSRQHQSFRNSFQELFLKGQFKPKARTLETALEINNRNVSAWGKMNKQIFSDSNSAFIRYNFPDPLYYVRACIIDDH